MTAISPLLEMAISQQGRSLFGKKETDPGSIIFRSPYQDGIAQAHLESFWAI